MTHMTDVVAHWGDLVTHLTDVEAYWGDLVTLLQMWRRIGEI